MLILALLHFAAPAIATTVKSEWVIRDPRLRARIMHAVGEYYRFALGDSAAAQYVAAHTQSGEVLVEAIDSKEENTRQVVALGIDSLRVAPAENVRAALGETLYDFITARKGYEYDVNRTTNDEQLCNTLWWSPEKIRISLDRQLVQLTPSFAIIDEIGNNNVQMPWWQYGMFRIGIAHANFRFMFQGPFSPGLGKLSFIGARQIEGAFGGAFQFRVENWSGELAFATLSKKSSIYDAFTRPPIINYVSTIGQVRYSIATSAGSWGALQVSFGGGLHKIKHDSLRADGYMNDASIPSPLVVSPIFHIAFVSAHDDVELTGQFYHSSLLFTAAVHVAGPIWVSGSAWLIKTLRQPEIFEPASFFFVSPEIRL